MQNDLASVRLIQRISFFNWAFSVDLLLDFKVDSFEIFRPMIMVDQGGGGGRIVLLIKTQQHEFSLELFSPNVLD